MISPIHLEYFSPLAALGLFGILGAWVVWLGMRSLNGLGAVRKWVAIGTRLLLILGLILVLGGVRYQREHRQVEVMVLRDLSDSTAYVPVADGATLREMVDRYMQESVSQAKQRRPGDRLGVIGFADRAIIEALPSTRLDLGAGAVLQGGGGTNVASAIQLALASLSHEAMHRLVLIWDGNQTEGNLEAAIEAAAGQGVPIDVVPLQYQVESALMMERLVAPTWKRENEPITLDIVLRSTGDRPVQGTLVVLHQGMPVDIDADTPGIQPGRAVTLKSGVTPVRVKLPPVEGGIHHFRAVFEPVGEPGAGVNERPTVVTSAMDAFTIVQGRGSILYIDNEQENAGEILKQAVGREDIQIKTASIEDLPRDLFAYQNYDAVILANVPNGAGGVDQSQDQALASYVNDMGGGLVMIGGPETFGAGGWQGSKVEKVLPVNMDIPARKEIGKGALVMIVHACEMPDGNYWGEQCALKAVDALSSHDHVGVISYDWSANGSNWDFPLQARGDGGKAKAAIKQMKVGDMPSFEDAMSTALHGSGGMPGLKESDARHKHVIIISDGDPQAPSAELLEEYRRHKVSVSTVSVYPHDLSAQGPPPTMRRIAELTKGRAYGPINGNFTQLPQIFIKEATVVRRTLIHENKQGIPLRLMPSLSDVVAGLGGELPPVYGMVLTARKPDPLIDVPIVGGKANDPILAHWQSGLGKSAVFTSDATGRWASQWVASPSFGKFWAQVIRSVARPPMSREMDIQTRAEGDTLHIVAETMDRENRRINFLNVTGQVVGPDMKAKDIQLNQTGPGRYEAVIERASAGAYVARLAYQGPKGEQGWQVAGAAINANPEMRDLRSNDALLRQVAERTGGRVLPPLDPQAAEFFRREGLKQTASPMPIWDLLLPALMGLLVVDVSIRRIAWDLKAIAAAVGRYAGTFRMRRVEQSASVDALRKLRDSAAEATPQASAAGDQTPRPQSATKFEAQGIEGELTQLVGGARADSAASKQPEQPQQPTGSSPNQSGEHTSSLLAARRRAKQKMDGAENQ